MISYYRDTNSGALLIAGLSTDTKPVTDIPNGALFIEIDTSKALYYDESTSSYLEKGSASAEGVLVVTENGDYSVVRISSVIVAVDGPSGDILIAENGIYDVSPYASATVSVPMPSGTIDITETGQYDVAEYRMASVNVTPVEEPLTELVMRTATTIDDDAITSFGSSVLLQFPALEYVSAPNCRYIGTQAFAHDSGLRSVYMPNVTSIANQAFYGCTSLEAVDMPLLSSVSANTFRGCTSLSVAKLDTVKTIQALAFSGCTALVSVYAPECTIVYSAFIGCTSLESVTLDACTNVDVDAFSGCTALREVHLPQAVSLGTRAFSQCTNLVSLYLPRGKVCSIGNATFYSTPIGGYSDVAGRYGSVYVPASLLASYQSDVNWSSISERIVGV